MPGIHVELLNVVPILASPGAPAPFIPSNAGSSTAGDIRKTAKNGLHVLRQLEQQCHLRLTAFLTMVLGVPTLEQIYELTSPGNEDGWNKYQTTLSSRLANVTVVSSLVLATTSAFLTTEPPTTIVNWLHPMPYVTLIAAFCAGFLSVGSGIFLYFVIVNTKPTRLRRLLFHPVRLTMGMVLMATPTLFLAASGGSVMVSMCGAVWLGDNIVAKIGLVATFVIWGLMTLASILCMLV
ncbi:hypothetical protein HGRIS_009806 [Hohenbuehelia grisea]|uniref:Uncharacterized protein n=1 Tax=Hohenbuehelia grisea TaxID=104357 RepID=A0ABR3J2H3_9AGAR